jgi:DNA-binding NarL/FixJ family response regulator
MPTTVSIVEDDPQTLEGLSQLINRAANFSCVSQHTSGEDAVQRVPAFSPQVVLMDINLPGMSGIETVRILKAQLPQTQFIMSTVCNDSDAIFSAITAGANGYLLKQTRPMDLLSALREASTGGSPMMAQIARKIVDVFRLTRRPAAENDDLTPREREVLELLAQGFLYKEIADQLKITYRTVSSHIEHIYRKLHVRSRSQAVAKFLVPG